jgi:hypothetical protein
VLRVRPASTRHYALAENNNQQPTTTKSDDNALKLRIPEPTLAPSPTQSFQRQKSNALQYPTSGSLFIYLSQIHLLKTETKIFRNQSVRTHCFPPARRSIGTGTFL